MGYFLAGFNVIGVDLDLTRGYPFAHIDRDPASALLDKELLSQVDAIHIGSSAEKPWESAHLDRWEAKTSRTSPPWIMERPNYSDDRATLCGTYFGLQAPVHRQFITNFDLPDLGSCACSTKLSPGSTPDFTRWIGEHVINHFFPGTPARDYLAGHDCIGWLVSP